METRNPKQPASKQDENVVHFKGTFIAVMLLGVFILVFWFGIYALFLSR